MTISFRETLSKLSYQAYRARQVRKTLDAVIKQLNKGDQASKELWDILSALRGPDTNDSNIKCVTTAPLRGALGLNLAWAIDIKNAPIEEQWEFLEKAGEHFYRHIVNAKRALEYFGYIKSREAVIDQALDDLNKL